MNRTIIFMNTDCVVYCWNRSQLQKLMNSDSSWSSQSNGGLSAPSAKDSAWLQLYLYACKLLDLAIALPADELPQFQMYRWAFVGDPSDDSSSSPTPRTPAAWTPDPSRSSQIQSATNADRLSIHSLNNNNMSDNRQTMKSPSPSPTPSRTSFGAKSLVSLSPVLPAPSGPFEPHVVRIEKTMKLKVSCKLDYHSFNNTLPLLTESKSGDADVQRKKAAFMADVDQKPDRLAPLLPHAGASHKQCKSHQIITRSR